ncbi:MAG TPA: hypothetical protein VF712_10300 [Thermoleophilaceae bacterium]
MTRAPEPAHISAAVAAAALARVLLRRHGRTERITPATRLDSLDLESVDLAEVFIEIEDLTGCAAVTNPMPALETVADFERIDCI